MHEQIQRQREEPVELLLCALAVDEHPDLVADRREHGEEIPVGLANLPAEELHDAEDGLCPRRSGNPNAA